MHYRTNTYVPVPDYPFFLVSRKGHPLYGYAARRYCTVGCLLVGRGWNPQDTDTRIHAQLCDLSYREMSPALAVGHSWEPWNPPFLEPGAHQTTGLPCFFLFMLTRS